MAIPTVAFPDHNIDPLKKDEKWRLQFAKAIWSNFNSAMPNGSIFYSKAWRYSEIRDYAMNRQSVSKYKKELLPDDEADSSYTKISWEPRADGKVLRNIAVAKLKKTGFNILATPITSNAKDAEAEAYAKIKARILMRDALERQGSELADNALIRRLPGEPEDLEELKMQVEFNPKLIRAKDIEESAQLVFYENNSEVILDGVAEDLVDFGVAVIKEDLDENNKVVFRKVSPDKFGCSYTEKPDFSDITYAFEVIPVKLSDLSKTFDENTMEMLKARAEGKNGNPTSFGDNTINENGYDIFKVEVMDVEFLSWNKRVTSENKDKNGNLRISKTDPKNDGKAGKGDNPKIYTGKTIEVVYKAKWIIGTDLIYDDGIAKNMKRTVNVKTMSKTSLSFHVFAANFHKMRATGMTEDMIPIIDDLNIATFKLRNFRNSMIPNGYDIDLDAIENVALGAGGEVLSPKEVLGLFTETGNLVSRRAGIASGNINYKAIIPLENHVGQQLVALANDIIQSKNALREITGLNELTDGSTPNPKTLTTIANFANESTNNALYNMMNAKRKLTESVARGVVQRLQVAVRYGPYDGFNKDTGRHITVPQSIAHYDYDIMIEDKPSEEQRQIVYQMMLKDIEAGNVSHADVISIIYTNNLKAAAILLSHKVEKNKKNREKTAIANTMATAQAQMQSNQQAEMIKDQMAENEHQRSLQKLNVQKAWDYLIQEQKNHVQDNAVKTKAMVELSKAESQQVQEQQLPQEQEAPVEE